MVILFENEASSLLGVSYVEAPHIVTKSRSAQDQLWEYNVSFLASGVTRETTSHFYQKNKALVVLQPLSFFVPHC